MLSKLSIDFEKVIMLSLLIQRDRYKFLDEILCPVLLSGLRCLSPFDPCNFMFLTFFTPSVCFCGTCLVFFPAICFCFFGSCCLFIDTKQRLSQSQKTYIQLTTQSMDCIFHSLNSFSKWSNTFSIVYLGCHPLELTCYATVHVYYL